MARYKISDDKLMRRRIELQEEEFLLKEQMHYHVNMRKPRPVVNMKVVKRNKIINGNIDIGLNLRFKTILLKLIVLIILIKIIWWYNMIQTIINLTITMIGLLAATLSIYNHFKLNGIIQSIRSIHSDKQTNNSTCNLNTMYMDTY